MKISLENLLKLKFQQIYLIIGLFPFLTISHQKKYCSLFISVSMGYLRFKKFENLSHQKKEKWKVLNEVLTNSF